MIFVTDTWHRTIFIVRVKKSDFMLEEFYKNMRNARLVQRSTVLGHFQRGHQTGDARWHSQLSASVLRSTC